MGTREAIRRRQNPVTPRARAIIFPRSRERYLDVFGIQLDPEIAPIRLQAGQASRGGAREWVQNDVVLRAAGADAELRQLNGIGREMGFRRRIRRNRPHRAPVTAFSRVESFKFSTDPQFARKVRDIVGLYLNPPDKVIVLSVDEKSQIQALDRTQPIPPLRPGLPARQTHDYQRHGTTTLFAALNVLKGTVIGECRPRHRHQEFLRFLDRIEQSVDANREVHLVFG